VKAVDIAVSSVQSQGMLPTLEGLIPGYDKLSEEKKTEEIEKWNEASNLNFVAVKVGSAIANILGKIYAGAVRVMATSEVDTDACNSALASFGLPLAVGVVVSEAGIKVGEGAIIKTTNGGMILNADSRVSLTTEARSGRIPFTLTAAVVFIEVLFDKKGKYAKDKGKRIAFLVLSSIVIVWAIISQLNYFRLVLTGHGYQL
jgi:hypothetical protein